MEEKMLYVFNGTAATFASRGVHMAAAMEILV